MEGALIVGSVLREAVLARTARTGFVLEMNVFPRPVRALTVIVGTVMVINARTTVALVRIAMVRVAKATTTTTTTMMTTTTTMAAVEEAQAGVLGLPASLGAV